MPSIEIICIGQREPIDFCYLPFYVEAESRLISHRAPKPLFQSDFDLLDGCIYHLGGSCLRFPPVREQFAYTASDLCIEWWEFLHFKPRYATGIRMLLQKLLEASPKGKLLFTSDYQFGPSKVRRYKQPLTLETFWQRHDAGQLWVNASFPLSRC